MPASELLASGADIGFSNLGLFSGGNREPVENQADFEPPLIEAASSATREERTEVSIWAEDVEAASFATTAAAAVFLFSSSVVLDVVVIIVWAAGARLVSCGKDTFASADLVVSS